MDELAAPAIQVVREGRIRIHPESQRRRYEEWLQNIRPWCISRQLWWGHQIPVWYRDGETYVGMQPPAGDGWERDPDVLDTWFSSALWPFATLGWPDDTPELRAFYPTDVLSTARDILFLWVARMVMMGLEFTGDVPFTDVYVHSVIQAPDGRRMSKSLGTGIDPLDEIDRHGADAVRFGLLGMSSTQDVKYSAEKIEQGQALANKLFNASRFVLLTVGDRAAPSAPPAPRTVEDRWILSRLQRAIAQTAARIEGYDFSKAALGLYDFVYGELCDWYLEMVKPREVDADLAATLVHVLRQTLSLAHPVIPFVTEELWSHVPAAEGLLAAGRFPEADESLIDEAAEREVADAIAAVGAVRSFRNEAGVRPGLRLPGAAGRRRLRADGAARRPPGAPGPRRRLGPRAGRARAGPRWRGRAAGRRGRRPGEAERRRDEQRERAAGGDRSRGGQARQPGLRRQGARAPGGRRAREARAPAPELEARVTFALDARRRRAPPPVARALRHAVRAGPRAPADDRARLPAGALRLRPRRRHQRQVVDGADDRGDPRGATACATGTYLSPHLVSFAERVRIGDRDAEPERVRGGGAARRARGGQGRPRARRGRPRDAVRAAHRRGVPAARRRGASRSPSSRPGSAGAYDATNVLRSRVQVLTNVGLEHTRWLGPTIAAHRPGEAGRRPPRRRRWSSAPACIPMPRPSPQAVCTERGARLVVAPADAEVPLLAAGAFQRRNFAVALTAAEAWLGEPAQPEAILHAAASTIVPGRFEVVDDAPTTILDGAHNPGGMAALADALRSAVHGRRVVAVVSILDDKDAPAMLRELLPLCERGRVHRERQSARAVAGDAAVPDAAARGPARADRRRSAARAGGGPPGSRPGRRRAGHGLDLPGRRPARRRRRGAAEVAAVSDDGPSVVTMMLVVAAVVAVVILVFFTVGYLFGRLFL